MAAKKTARGQIIRAEIQLLVEELPDKELYGVKRFLAYLRNTSDPLTQKLLESSYTDEHLTEEEAKAVDEAWDAVARGDVLSDEELGRQLGL